MTAQLSDTFQYRRHDFTLAGIKGSGLFEPTAHGLSPRSMSTACYHGFLCTYGISDGAQLVLKELRIGLAPEEEAEVKAGRGKPLFGKVPRYVSETHERVVYERLRGPVAFSGGLLIAHGFVRELYVHMGYHPAWKFKEVHELVFEEGRLVEAHDCSDAMARIRERLRKQPLAPGSTASKGEIEQWISKTFRLDYD